MKAQEQAEMEKMEELQKVIEASPLTQKIKEEKAAEILAKRREAAGKIEVLKKERDEVIPRLRSNIDAKEVAYLKAKAALDVLFDKLRTAKTALSGENCQFDNDIRLQEQILYETADPRIDEGIQFFRDKLDDLRKPGRVSSRGMNVERNIFTDTKTLTTESNKGAVLTALAYCQAAIKGLEELKLWPEFHIEGIQELKDELPSIEVYQEVTGEKPLPRINTAPPLKSDSQLTWELSKLNEKFKKVMGRLI